MSASADSCSSPILEPDRSALLQEALADPQLQAVKAQLERRGLSINTDEAQAVQLAGGQQLLIPFEEDAHLVWTRTNGQTAAVGLIRQGNKTLNISVTGEERVVRFLPVQKVEKLLSALRQKSKFQDFEQKLAQKGKRVGKIRVLFDETNKIAILGIANEGDEERIAHQVRIKMKPDKDDEPEDDAEPAIQATACGQATGEAVPAGARMHAQMYDAGEGGDVSPSGSYNEGYNYEGPEICVSQWGYDYLCTWTTPLLSLSLTGFPLSLTLPQTFITQQVQASFVIWNGGGGRLTGTVSVPAPFSIISGASFSLLPGQPQEVVVRFSSGTAGSFSKSISISSNAGGKTVSATGVAHKVSFSPATLDFGSGLLVLREQCNKMDVCGLRTEKVGLPIEKTFTVKNEGTVAVTLTLSTSAPYKIVSAAPTLSPGQSGQVTVRFDPNESGNFTGTVQVGINGGQGSVNSSPLVGVAHKIEIQPAELNFGVVIVGTTREQKLTVKNQGVTIVPLTMSTAAPFSMGSESSFTLAPSESRDVAVQVSPTTSGDLQGVVHLTTGAAFKELPALGKAYTEEEYREILKQSILATCQATEEGFPTNLSQISLSQPSVRNIYFIPGFNQDFLFYRIPCPTEEELDALFNLLLALQGAHLDDYLGPDLFGNPTNLNNGLKALKDRINELIQNQTDMRTIVDAILGYLEFTLLPQNPGLAEFVQAISGPSGSNYIAVIRSAIGIGLALLIKFAGLSGPWAQAPFVYALGNLLYTLLTVQQWPAAHLTQEQIEARKFVVALATIMAATSRGQSAISAVINATDKPVDSRMNALIVITFAGIAALSLQGPEMTSEHLAIQSAGLTLSYFEEFLKWVAIAYALYNPSSPNDPRSRVQATHLSAYMQFLSSLIIPAPTGREYWERYANNIGGFIVLVALSQDEEHNWQIHGGSGWFNFPYGPDVQLVATTTIEGRAVTVFIHVEAKLKEDEVNGIVSKVHQIIESARRWREANSDIGGSTTVIVLIVFDAEGDALNKLEQAIASSLDPTSSPPVIILYRNKQGGWEPKIIGNPNDQNFLNAVAAALAQALSTSYQGGSQDTWLQALALVQQAPILARLAYPGVSPRIAWHLAFGICGGDLGCILMIAESIKEWLNENAAANCQRYRGAEPASRFKALMPC